MPYHPFTDIHFMIFSGLLFLPSPKSGLHKSELKKPEDKIVLVSNLVSSTTSSTSSLVIAITNIIIIILTEPGPQCLYLY